MIDEDGLINQHHIIHGLGFCARGFALNPPLIFLYIFLPSSYFQYSYNVIRSLFLKCEQLNISETLGSWLEMQILDPTTPQPTDSNYLMVE